MQTSTSTKSTVIRRATPHDAERCGSVCYQAFAAINAAHNFPPDIPSTEHGVGLLKMLFSHPGFYSVVAEVDGQLGGSNALDERGMIGGIGPITVSPEFQNRGVGRGLMQAVIERGQERNLAGLRLLQAAFHNRSLSLYTKLGFDAREPVSVMQGPAIGLRLEGITVRPATEADLGQANAICERVHGHNRSGDLEDSIRQGSARVAERGGRVTGYASSVGFFGHAVAETDADLQALIAAAERFEGPGILVPTRSSQLFRWCLAQGLRVVYPMTLMTLGLYNEPRGAWLPSILY